MAVYEGGCQCGAVRYRLRRESLVVYGCHCRECQKQSASAFGLSVPFSREELELVGELASWRRPTDSGSFTTCYYCPSCGVRLYHVSDRNLEGGTIKGGTLDDTSTLEPRFHMWTSRKQPWLDLGDAVQFETQPSDFAQIRELMR